MFSYGLYRKEWVSLLGFSLRMVLSKSGKTNLKKSGLNQESLPTSLAQETD